MVPWPLIRSLRTNYINSSSSCVSISLFSRMASLLLCLRCWSFVFILFAELLMKWTNIKKVLTNRTTIRSAQFAPHTTQYAAEFLLLYSSFFRVRSIAAHEIKICAWSAAHVECAACSSWIATLRRRRRRWTYLDVPIVLSFRPSSIHIGRERTFVCVRCL